MEIWGVLKTTGRMVISTCYQIHPKRSTQSFTCFQRKIGSWYQEVCVTFDAQIQITFNRSDNPFLQFSFHDISSYSLLNETLTTTTPSPNQRMDRNAKLMNKTFDPMLVYKQFGNLTNATMRVIVHGFGSSCPHEWITEMRAALMAVEECFVMCTDWEKGAILPK
jgi:hypothetical protein